MSRLIDADELKKSIPETTDREDCVLNCDLMSKEYVDKLIDQAPTIDIEGEKNMAYQAGFEEGYNAGLSAGAGGVVCG